MRERTRELETAKQKAEESDMLKSAFLSNMSHEIRTPMNDILGFSELLSASGFTEEERESFAKMVRSNGDSLLTLLNDIIDISMIESGQLKLNFSDVDLNEIFNNTLLSFESSMHFAEKEHVRLLANIPKDENVFIKTDSQRLLQILNNFIGNAIKFTDEGYIKFGYRKEDENVLFFVKETGVGIRK